MGPILTIVVVVFSMPEQARRTLHTLSPAYQHGVPADAYEVVVVENESPRLLGEAAALASGPHVRYFLRPERSESPVAAANFGAEQARGEVIGVMVDGARLLSPGVVELALLTHRATDRAALSIPGYHLGSELQQRAVAGGYDEIAEADLLESIGWPLDGYRLFDVACLSGSCAGGFFAPFAESNCLCVPRAVHERLGGFDSRFLLRGGGYSNLDYYARVCAQDDVTLFVAPGEGTFHQFHRGVTTGGGDPASREALMAALHDEYRAIRGKDFALPTREPLFVGRIAPSARRFVVQSTKAWERP